MNAFPYVVVVSSWGDGEGFAGTRPHSERFATRPAAERAVVFWSRGESTAELIEDFDEL